MDKERAAQYYDDIPSPLSKQLSPQTNPDIYCRSDVFDPDPTNRWMAPYRSNQWTLGV